MRHSASASNFKGSSPQGSAHAGPRQRIPGNVSDEVSFRPPDSDVGSIDLRAWLTLAATLRQAAVSIELHLFLALIVVAVSSASRT